MARKESTKFLYLMKRSRTGTPVGNSFPISETDLQVKKVEIDGEEGIEDEVDAFHPTHVVIESLWVNPEKFALLTHLYPDIKWIVRIRKKSMFLVKFGIGGEWIKEYVKYRNVYIKLCA